ncbi:Glycosyltransferase involved in cell wall bisynthesis [Sphingomonas guangdongensis]|uniref:Glycosyltransferase involved in cell wall bisynthesis n=1 Tax=Sphingomonas guangdongensis TaxID=1141890 RepID=A0A285QEH1_9SPHN|nr:glycosyltransferase [Sphingomonas guangdongensis]SOB78537.1 Glycosyltransferase involved in cell wall bisynthesis [Sphingomonas guangdongensis]
MLRVLTLASLFPDASRPNFGVFVERQTRGLAAHPDVDLRVVAPVGLPPPLLDRLPTYRALRTLPRHETWRGLSVHRPRFLNLPGTAGRFHAASLARAVTPLLARLRREFPFDVIDAEFFFPEGPAAVALGRRFGVPVSIKARGADIHHWGTAQPTAAQVIAAGQAADGCLAVSAAMRDDMAALGIPAERIRVHRTGIDAGRFSPRNRAAERAKLGVAGPLVLSVGALIPRKGHDVVIDAVARLPGVTLWIAGAGPEAAALEARIAAAGVGDRVQLIGPVPHDDLPILFAAADVMALASASEGLANVWVEALSSGTPIVITDVGGAHETVDRPAAGRVVAREVDAFAAAIAELLATPPAPDEVRAAAARFSWAANTAELYAHLSGLVGAHRAPAAAGG